MSVSVSHSCASYRYVAPLRLLALGLAVLSAGCASNRSVNGPYAQSGIGRGPAPQVAAAPQVEIEDDGLPSQTPPRWRTSVEPDDPNEPFSRNYGGSGAPNAAPVRMLAPAKAAYHPAPSGPAIPAALPRTAALATHGRIVAEDEQELIIMRAVAAHEQRRQ